MAPVVLVDACVWYPIRLCDLFIRLHLQSLLTLRWTRQIQDEWVTRLVSRSMGQLDRIRRRAEAMERAVDDWEVVGYEPLVNRLRLPDPNDRHVVAAAIHCHADYLVTANVRDLGVPTAYRGRVLSPDDLLVSIAHQHKQDTMALLRSAQASLRNPPKSFDEYLGGLSDVGLIQFVSLVSREAHALIS